MRPFVVTLALVALVGACAGSAPPVATPPAGATGSPTPPAAAPPVTVPAVPPLHPSVDDYPDAIVRLTHGTRAVAVAVKVADTPERRSHGLMEVESLPDGTGMLFVFEEDRRGAFWMKDTLVPLDIAFIAADGAVLAILHMTPCVSDPCERYDPRVAYRYALEVPAGWLEEVGVDTDWRLQLP